MDNIEYLFAGFAVFWAGLFIYLLLLQTRLRSLQRDIEQLEERLAEAQTTGTEGAPRATSSPPSAPAVSSRPSQAPR